VDSTTSVDPAWKVVYGSVERGPKYTTFYVEVVRSQNHLRIFRRVKEYNTTVDRLPTIYSYILDKIVYELDNQLKR
jgi:hypothetical protein